MSFSSLIRGKVSRNLATTAILTEQCPHCKADPAASCDPYHAPYEEVRRLSPEGQFLRGGELIMAHISRIWAAIKAANISPARIIHQAGGPLPPED